MKKLAFVVVLVAAIVGIVFGGLSMASASLPVGPNQPPYPTRTPTPTPEYKYVYTTGPFMLPQNAGPLDWVLLNNDSTEQRARVTVYQCPPGVSKITMPPGSLEVTLGRWQSQHNSNPYPLGFAYEVQVECNSQLVFPYVSVWTGGMGFIIPGTGINSGDFTRQMP